MYHLNVKPKKLSIGSNGSISNAHITRAYGEHTQTNDEYESNKKINCYPQNRNVLFMFCIFTAWPSNLGNYSTNKCCINEQI